MASLTPLSKGIIGLVVIGAVGYTVWRLAFKDPRQGEWTAPQAAQQAPAAKPVVAAPLASAAPLPAPAPPAAAAAAAPVKPAPAPMVAAKSPAPGLSPAQNSELGRKLLNDGDHAQARVHLEWAVKGGDAAAACHLGEMTMKGQGGIQANQDKAAELFRVAQTGGVICFTLGK